jgi:glycosyltransferase involved in cell wall biosynthesis
VTSARRPERISVVMLIESLDFDPGGAERLVAGLATHLPRDRFEVTLCTTRAHRGPLLDQVTGAGVRHLALDRRTRLDMLAWRHLVGLLRREEVDILHAHMWGSNFWGALLGRACRVPVVIAHEHGWAYEGMRFRRLIDGYFIGRLATVFLTVANRDLMIEWERVPEHKVELMPNPYIPRPPTVNGDLRAELGLDAKTPVVGTIARLRRQKALDLLIDAFANVSRSMPEARLLIAGDGPCRDELERQAAARAIDDRVHFLGMREDVDVVLRAFDVAAISSNFEGLPLFGLECMATRTPLVSTDVGGMSEQFEHGRTALLVPPGDATAMAQALEGLLRDPGRRQAIADAAYERVADFHIDRVVAHYEELYGRLLSRARQRSTT